jgi:hypothetical protein
MTDFRRFGNDSRNYRSPRLTRWFFSLGLRRHALWKMNVDVGHAANDNADGRQK